MAEALQQQLQQAATRSLSFEERIAQLGDAQWLGRENRTTAPRLRQARLKQPASLDDVNYRHPRQLDRALLRSLASITLLSLVAILRVAHTWRSLPCVRTVRIHRKSTMYAPPRKKLNKVILGVRRP